MIFDFASAAELAQAPLSYRQLLVGATRKARELGYGLQPCFFEGPSRQAEGRRIGRVLACRGITGIIICAFRARTTRFELDWSRFSAVQIESHHLDLPLHNVSTDQLLMAREAVRRLAQRGCRRIGIAIGRDEEIYLDHAFTLGFFGEASLHPGLELAPPLMLRNGETAAGIAPALRQWIHRHRIEAIISNWHTVPASLAASRADGIPDPDVVILGLAPEESPYDGIRQRDAEVGEQAVEQLAMLMKTNQTGPVVSPNRILVPGAWVAGRRPVESTCPA